jgi:hypothetical protein
MYIPKSIACRAFVSVGKCTEKDTDTDTDTDTDADTDNDTGTDTDTDTDAETDKPLQRFRFQISVKKFNLISGIISESALFSPISEVPITGSLRYVA